MVNKIVTPDPPDKKIDPTPVIIAPEQPPVPVIQVAPDGVTPVPVPSLGVEANTIPGGSSPVVGYEPAPTPDHTPKGTSVNMTVNAPRPSRPDVVKGEGATLAPTTTEAEDVEAAENRIAQASLFEGQQKINSMWERTQSWIALMVVVAGVMVNSIVVVFIIFFNKEVSVTQLSLITINLQFINLTTGIVIGFYFSRTNHSARGGVGPKPEAPYTGR